MGHGTNYSIDDFCILRVAPKVLAKLPKVIASPHFTDLESKINFAVPDPKVLRTTALITMNFITPSILEKYMSLSTVASKNWLRYVLMVNE